MQIPGPNTSTEKRDTDHQEFPVSSHLLGRTSGTVTVIISTYQFINRTYLFYFASLRQYCKQSFSSVYWFATVTLPHFWFRFAINDMTTDDKELIYHRWDSNPRPLTTTTTKRWRTHWAIAATRENNEKNFYCFRIMRQLLVVVRAAPVSLTCRRRGCDLPPLCVHRRVWYVQLASQLLAAAVLAVCLFNNAIAAIDSKFV